MYIHLFIHRFTLRYAFFFLIHIKFQMILLQIMVLLIHLDTLSFSEFIGLNVRFNRTLAITFLLRSFINSLYQSSEIIPKFLCSNNLSFSLYFIIDRSYAFLFLSMNARKICILRNINGNWRWNVHKSSFIWSLKLPFYRCSSWAFIPDSFLKCCGRN